MLDAGHGGIDTGTSSAMGLHEKDLVLDVVKRVRKALQSRGAYTVDLTRDDDTYIPLGQRVRVARNYSADLFVSIHADSNPSSSVYGASVYTLSDSGSDKEAAALAQKENQSDIIAGVDLSNEDSPVASILIDLTQRDTMNRRHVSPKRPSRSCGRQRTFCRASLIAPPPSPSSRRPMFPPC